jgi:hypothetical protein
MRNSQVMARLKADFEADLKAHARRVLTAEWGSEIAAINDANILIHFFDAQRRRIAAHPRTIEIADDFACPPDQQGGWTALQQRIRNGDDLGPHMSTRHKSLVNRDGLLNEWGVHHFHLGMNPHPRDPNYIERTGPVVFALVEQDVFRAINVYEHQEWEELSVVESLHRNWPDAIRPYRLKANIVAPALANAERRNVRNAGGQTGVTVQDGTVYGSIAGPVSTAGTKYTSVRNADHWVKEVRHLQSYLDNDLSPFMQTLIEAGYGGEEEIDAEFQVAEDGRYQVFFLKYQRIVILNPPQRNA